MSNFSLDNIKTIHFIGIGGSGMCPLAEILLSRGFNITGSDCNEGDTLDRIKSYGIKVYMGHFAENVQGADLVVYSAAIKSDNPERISAKEKGIPTLERSQMLGLVVDKYKDSIAVSGTHGKTSTTAMITQILMGCKKDPSAIIGGKLPFIGGNSIVGKSEIMVCEACEYVNTFLQLHPAISVISNVEADHLDFFKDLDDIKNSFNKFAKQTTKLLVINGDDENSVDCTADVQLDKLFYGFNSINDYYAENYSCDGGVKQSFDLMHNGECLTRIKLTVPGKHNVMNALAAITVAIYLGAEPQDIAQSIEKFTGVHRRFEVLGEVNGITVADDFAHHPTELTVTLNSAMAMGFNKVWAVFQPHTFSRTFMLLDDFAKALSIPDEVIISEILPVRETNTYNIYAEDLCAKVDGSVYRQTFDQITEYVCSKVQPGDLILTMGGGNVYMCANQIYAKLKEIYK